MRHFVQNAYQPVIALFFATSTTPPFRLSDLPSSVEIACACMRPSTSSFPLICLCLVSCSKPESNWIVLWIWFKTNKHQSSEIWNLTSKTSPPQPCGLIVLFLLFCFKTNNKFASQKLKHWRADSKESEAGFGILARPSSSLKTVYNQLRSYKNNF